MSTTFSDIFDTFENVEEDMKVYVIACCDEFVDSGNEDVEELELSIEPFMFELGLNEDEISLLTKRLLDCTKEKISTKKNNKHKERQHTEAFMNTTIVPKQEETTKKVEPVNTQKEVSLVATPEPDSKDKSKMKNEGKKNKKKKKPKHQDDNMYVKEPKVVVSVEVSRFYNALEDQISKKREIEIKKLTIEIENKELLTDAHLHLFPDRRYGLIGENGVGKTTLLKQLAGDTLLGKHLKVLLVDQEHIGDTLTPVQAVVASDEDLGHLIRFQSRIHDAMKLYTLFTQQNSERKGSVTEEEAYRSLISFYLEIDAERAEKETYDQEIVASKLSGVRGKSARNKIVELRDVSDRKRKISDHYKRESALIGGDKTDEAEETDEEKEGEELTASSYEIPSFEFCLGCVEKWLQENQEQIHDIGGLEEKNVIATSLLKGLSFTEKMMTTSTIDLSGGWRMRVALARALFMKPQVLLLDEPSNYLDLEAIVWLENWILSDHAEDEAVIIVVSHDREFLNNVCDEIIVLKNKQLQYYAGNYDSYRKAFETKNLHDERLGENLEKKKAEMKKSMDAMMRKARQSGDDKRVKQVVSRKKKLDERMGVETNAHGHRFKLNRDRAGYHTSARDDVTVDNDGDEIKFTFPVCDPTGYYGALLQVDNLAFAYDKEIIFKDITLNIDLSSRIAIVGENGAGKSTFLKVLTDELKAKKGSIKRHHNLRIVYLSQHINETLDVSKSSIDILKELYPEEHEQVIRTHLGRFSVKGSVPLIKLRNLSGGQRARACLAILMYRPPHIIIMDEPTAHLDIKTVDAFIDAIKEFKGGVVLVSHDRNFLRETGEIFYFMEAGKGMSKLENGLEDYLEIVRNAID